MSADEKVLFEELIKAVNNTDWWMFAITAVSVVASAVLSLLLWNTTKKIGKRQNEIAKRQNEIAEQQTTIQKQQYKIEKFNNYKDLHRDIYRCKCLLDYILPKVYEYFVAADRGVQKNSVNEFISKLAEMLPEVQNRVSDAMLRDDKQLNVQSVLELLVGAGSLLIKATENPPLGMNTFDWATTLVKGAEFRETLKIEEQASCINALAKDPSLKAGMELFVKQYKEVFEGENNILAQLQHLYNE